MAQREVSEINLESTAKKTFEQEMHNALLLWKHYFYLFSKYL